MPLMLTAAAPEDRISLTVKVVEAKAVTLHFYKTVLEPHNILTVLPIYTELQEDNLLCWYSVLSSPFPSYIAFLSIWPHCNHAIVK
jgi:hypothetical protein